MTGSPKLIVVGQIAGAFGVKGEVRIRSFTEDPEACFAYGPLLDTNGAVILTPVKHRPLGDLFGVTTKEQRQREEWEAMKGTPLHAFRDALPQPEEGEIYVADLIGMSVAHADGRVLGKVKDSVNYGAGDLIDIEAPGGGSYLLPFTEEVFSEIDAAGRRLIASPDEELLPESLQRHISDGSTNLR